MRRDKSLFVYFSVFCGFSTIFYLFRAVFLFLVSCMLLREWEIVMRCGLVVDLLLSRGESGVRLAGGGMKPVLKPQEEFRIEQVVNEQ